MSYTVRLLANAQRDLADIEAYYDEQAPHETERCLDAIEAALDWIAEHAHQPPVRRFGLRFVSTETFRYYVWYRLFEEECFVQICTIDAETTRSPSGCPEHPTGRQTTNHGLNESLTSTPARRHAHRGRRTHGCDLTVCGATLR